jgi:hypothetical protein
MTMKKIAALFLLLPSLAFGAVVIQGAGTSNQAKVNTANSLQVNEGPSMRATYYASVAGATTTAAWNIACEAGATTGFKLSQYCVSLPLAATAAGTIITVTLRRTTAAGSGGTALAADGAGTTAITRADTGSAAFPGTCRGLASTSGTAGAVFDQFQFPQIILPATTSSPGPVVICRHFGQNGDQLPTVPVGTANGLILGVSAAGAGSLAVGAASMVLIAE